MQRPLIIAGPLWGTANLDAALHAVPASSAMADTLAPVSVLPKPEIRPEQPRSAEFTAVRREIVENHAEGGQSRRTVWNLAAPDEPDASSAADTGQGTPGADEISALHSALTLLNYVDVEIKQITDLVGTVAKLEEAGFASLEDQKGIIDSFHLITGPENLDTALEALTNFGHPIDTAIFQEAKTAKNINLYPLLKKLKDDDVATAADRKYLIELFELTADDVESEKYATAIQLYKDLEGDLDEDTINEAKELEDIQHSVWLRNFKSDDPAQVDNKTLFLSALIMVDILDDSPAKDGIRFAIILCGRNYPNILEALQPVVMAQLRGATEGTIAFDENLRVTLNALGCTLKPES